MQRETRNDQRAVFIALGACAAAPPSSAIAFYALLRSFRHLDSHQYDGFYCSVFFATLAFAGFGCLGSMTHLAATRSRRSALMLLASITGLAWALIFNLGVILRFVD